MTGRRAPDSLVKIPARNLDWAQSIQLGPLDRGNLDRGAQRLLFEGGQENIEGGLAKCVGVTRHDDDLATWGEQRKSLFCQSDTNRLVQAAVRTWRNRPKA